MRVRCDRVANPLGALVTPQVGNEYVVLEVNAAQDRAPLIRIALDEHHSQPSLWPCEMFTVVNGEVPPHWRVHIDDSGAVALGPPRWLSHRFWDDYFDGQPGAVQEYKASLAMTLAINS